MLNNIDFNFSNESFEEIFLSMGVPKNLAEILMYISQNNEKKKLKKDRFYLNYEDYNQDEYNIFIYETCKYPLNSNPHQTLN